MAWALNSKAPRPPYENLDVGRASREWFGGPCAQSVLNPYFQFHWCEKLQVWLMLAMISTMNWMFASLQNSSFEVLFSLSHFCSVVSYSLQLHGLCPPGFSVHEILQARILEWVAISFSRRFFPTQGLKPRIKPRFSALQADFLLSEPPG